MGQLPPESADDEARGRFCPWYPLAEALGRAPKEPGVFQIKRVGALLSYPRGKSAMVLYGYGDVLASAMPPVIETLSVHRESARLVCRHQLVADGRAAEQLYRSVLDQFVARFGEPPTLPPAEESGV